jgi:DNA-binding NtrC family response regulator
MRSLAETAARVAATDIPILITGETGTGKEVLARLIHAKSSRGKKPFLPFNCTSVPREMMDSQLFGHRRGAFTGASDNFQGVIRTARGGTLLLDEIGDLGLESQPKLLRFLESGEVLPLGESSPVQADVRVIAATNADLDAAVSNGRFREDLYYRLNIVQLRVPPLRQRRVEIPSLSRHYLQMFATQFNKGDLRLEEETLESLVLFNWPGNIRQLANEMRRLAALAEDGAVLMPDALSPEIYKSRGELPPLASSPPVESDRLLVRLDQPIAEVVEGIERAMLRFAMERHEGRVDAVAKALGLSRKGLYLKRQRYRIDGFGAGSA